MKIKVSVCVATYNGEIYIEKQINSILQQISTNDEIVIVDDCSNDNTLKIIHKIGDARIKLFTNNRNIGINRSFEKALILAQGDIIFLSDQDDIWLDKKIDKILVKFEDSNIDIIQHDVAIVDDRINIIHQSFFYLRNANKGIFKNFVSNTYLGCSMAIRKTAIKHCLPIPKHSGYHDRWLGVIAEIEGLKVLFVKDNLMYYVRHKGTGSNLKRRSIITIIYDRLDFLRAIFVFYSRKLFQKLRGIK